MPLRSKKRSLELVAYYNRQREVSAKTSCRTWLSIVAKSLVEVQNSLNASIVPLLLDGDLKTTLCGRSALEPVCRRIFPRFLPLESCGHSYHCSFAGQWRLMLVASLVCRSAIFLWAAQMETILVSTFSSLSRLRFAWLTRMKRFFAALLNCLFLCAFARNNCEG